MRGCWGVRCLNCKRSILVPHLSFDSDLPKRPAFSPTYLRCAVCGKQLLYDREDLLPFLAALTQMELDFGDEEPSSATATRQR
jgi:hypothetical protein